MEHRPYREINEPLKKPKLVHLIIGFILFTLMFFSMLFMWSLIEPKQGQINDKAPSLEQIWSKENK